MKDELKEFLEQVDQKLAKGQENATTLQQQLATEAKARTEELGATVKQLSEDLAKKDITIQEMQTKVLDFIAKQGKLVPGGGEAGQDFKDVGSIFGDMISKNVGQFANVFNTKGLSLEHKVVGDMTTSNNHTGASFIQQFQRPPLVFPQFRHMRSILSVIPSDALVVDYPREKTTDGEGSFGPQTEGSAKEQLDIDTEMINLILDYEAGFATVTRQMLTNVPWLQNYLTRKLTEKFYRREDVKTLNFIHSLATAATTSATVVAEALIDMIAQVDNFGYSSNGILTTPAHWASILKTKPSDYSIPGGVAISPSGEILIGGLPLYKHQNVTTGNLYVGDWNAYYIVQGGAFNIRTSEHHSDNFTKNKVTFLAETAIGIAGEAAQAVVKKTI
jgi:HK97 family phage major capsid protein